VTVDLEKSLDVTKASAKSTLAQLQPNILKPHVRDHLAVLLLSFGDGAQARGFLKAVADDMKSAKAHLHEVDQHRRHGTRGSPYVGVGLSFDGYRALGIAANRIPGDASFRLGMRAPATRRKLRDPRPGTWEPPYRAPIHAIVLVGDAGEAAVSERRARIVAAMRDSVVVVGEETGLYQRNADKDGIEHFGYVDGRSQPLFTKQDVAQERATTDGADTWDREFPLKQILVRDPGVHGSGDAFGSYLVFRKLEQNVQRFKEEEERFADTLGLTGEDRERAGALLVGRFEDGTPLTLQGEAGAHHPVMNDFGYAGDAAGLKCPHFAHIRKVNPRDPETRRHLMARRGQTYGVRFDDPSGEDVPSNRRPTGGVGLLFMAFNSDIADQFEHTQQQMANAVGDGATRGMDQLIGQAVRRPVTSPTGWGQEPHAKGVVQRADPVAQAVTMKGGEYFFAPSLTFLKAL
jgi:Dyp-type peroxidase family